MNYILKGGKLKCKIGVGACGFLTIRFSMLAKIFLENNFSTTIFEYFGLKGVNHPAGNFRIIPLYFFCYIIRNKGVLILVYFVQHSSYLPGIGQ